MSVYVRLTSDNYSNCLMTVDAYEEIVLQMSTGDYACHKYKLVVGPESAFVGEILTLDDITE